MAALRPVDAAAAEILAGAQPIKGAETLPLAAAYGRYLAEDLIAQVDVPPAAMSAMDGYAFRHGAVAAGEWLPVSARIAAGSVGGPLEPGALARVFTGTALPAGADTVVIQEDTATGPDGQVRIERLPPAKDNVRPKGQDVAKGACILPQGSRLRPQAVALIASIGRAEVKVRPRLKVALLSTGDELIEPGAKAAPGQIYNANRYALAGCLAQLGMEAIDMGRVPDSLAATQAALKKAAKAADVILATGGVSVGEEDHLRPAVESLGHIQIWKLAIKPGKPLAFGQAAGKPLFGLPGNPVSSFVTFHIIAKPYLVAAAGGVPAAQVYSGIADFAHQAGDRREYLRVRATLEGAQVRLRPHQSQGSAILSSLVWASALAQVEPHQQVRPGTPLPFHPY